MAILAMHLGFRMCERSIYAAAPQLTRKTAMNKKTVGFTMLSVAFLVGAVALFVVPGCSDAKNNTGKPAPTQPAATEGAKADDAKDDEAKHQAYHGGCLNAIETCALGHAEVKLEDDTLKVWFVGGESHTDAPVRVTDKQIVLAVKPDGGEEKTLKLDPMPNKYANEEVGNCSHFEAKADWLKGLKKFDAQGKVTLADKDNPLTAPGREKPIKIEYPKGYDPD
jgi:hypothetical protein